MADETRQITADSDKEGEGETFEDAQDTTSRPETPALKTTHDLPASVTDGEPSSATSTPKISNPDMMSVEAVETPVPASRIEDGGENVAVPKSPLLTAHRVSVSSTENLQLDTKLDNLSVKSGSSMDPPAEKAVNRPSSPTKSQKSRGLSGNLPSIPWGPSPSKNTTSSSTSSSGPKKLGMSFSWLSRGGSASKETNVTPPAPPNQSATSSEKRNTITSLSSLSSNPDLMIRKLEESNENDGSQLPTVSDRQRDSLRERFKMLRLREEAGARSPDSQGPMSPSEGSALAGLIGRSASVGLGIGSPTSFAEERGIGQTPSQPQSPETAIPPMAMTSPNLSLAPGTASGVSAGVSALTDPAVPVNWDLWQSVVYEGPAAVARTSAEELSRAIMSGIPSAIRGVVWQVLAQSKNEELEGVYRELVVRGTDKDRDHVAALNGVALPAGLPNGHDRDKQSVASSESSIHSDHSTPVNAAINGLTSPPSSYEKDHESILKSQAAVVAERKQKAKEDALSLQKLEKVIRRDLGARTSYSKFAAASGLQDGLFGVCKAYALFDEGVGYAQGMNFLVMPLLFNMPEEEAFCLLVRMMNQYHLRELFVQDMPGLHLHLYQFERLLEEFEPALYCHLHRRGVAPQLYATQWFLTLFAYRFPLQLVLRVYDLILSEGLEGAILKFGVVLMQKNAETLLEMNDMASLTTFLKERLFDVYIDQAPSASSILESGFFGSSGGIDKEIYRADILVQDACAVKITPEMLKTYASEWEEKRRAEKEREAEIDSLKSLNASLAMKVRSLEERTEKSDAEHVQMASELVRTKVENQELHDSIESLKGQSEELRNLVERQPEEVEHRLKAEMERIMQRNVEVQNENRGLEEQMAEMEKELVQTKMQFAEINSEHENLKQRWLDLRKAIGA